MKLSHKSLASNPEEILWRICYGKEEDEEENPLIEPCNCSGSMKYIHYLWAKKWIEDRLTIESNEDVKTYTWERVKCELWNSKFKSIIIKNNRHIKLFEKEKLEEDVSLTLDLVYPDDIKMLYWLKINKYEDYKKFRIGRSQTCDIKINQETISRIHAKINFEDDEFFIKDLDSTYGTMVLLKEPLRFYNSKRNETCLVNGSTLIEIKYGEKKHAEETYISKEGDERRCVVYSDFKNKIPINMRNFIDKHLKTVTSKTPEVKIKPVFFQENFYEGHETVNKNNNPTSHHNIELSIDCEDKHKFAKSGNGKINIQDASGGEDHLAKSNESMNQRKHKHILRDNFLPSIIDNNFESEFHIKVDSLANKILNHAQEKKKLELEPSESKIVENKIEKSRSNSDNEVSAFAEDKSHKPNRNASMIFERSRLNRLSSVNAC